MKKFFFVSLVLILSLLHGGLWAFDTRVMLNVGGNEAIKNQIESYIARELRSLGDVELSSDQPVWEMHVLGMEPTTKGGSKNGIIIAVTILRKINLTEEVWSDKYKPLSKISNELSVFQNQYLYTGAIEDLKQVCSTVVADFDSSFLKEERVFYQKLKDK